MTEQSGGDRIGSLSVDIIADLAPLSGAKGQVEAVLKTFPTEVRIKVDASELTRVQDAARTVNTALRAIERTIGQATKGSATKITFAVDTAKLRSDIVSALREPFKVKLEIENLAELRQMLGSVPVAAQHGAPVIHQAIPAAQPATARRPAPSREEFSQNPDLRKALHELYNNLDRHLQLAGRPSLGPATDDASEKFGRMVDRFGSHLDDFIQVDERGRTKGGALSKQALTATGIPAPDATALNALAKDFQRLARTTTLFQNARANVPEPTASPVIQATVRAAEAAAHHAATAAVTEALPAALRKAGAASQGPDTSTLLGRLQAAASGNTAIGPGRPGAQPLKTDLSDTLRQFVEVQAGIGRVQRSRATNRRTGTTTGERLAGSEAFGGGTAAPEAEQEAASARLQPNRRLTGLLTVQRPGGSVIDMSGLARAAQAGTFARLGREVGGEKRLVELSTEDLAAFDRITAAGRRSSARRAEFGGRTVEKVNPFEEFVRQAEALYGPEARVGIEARTPQGATTRQQIQAYLSAGSRLALPGSGVEYRASAETGRTTMYGSGLGRAGTGFSKATVEASREERLRQNVMAAQRAMNPTYAATLRAAERAHSTTSQANLNNPRFPDVFERLEREYEERQRAGQVRGGIESGVLPSPSVMIDEIRKRINAQTEGGPGGTRAGQRAIRESWQDMVTTISNQLGLGINTNASPKRIDAQLGQAGLGYISDVRRAMYGELGTRELFAQQDQNRMPEQGRGDRLGTEMMVNGKRVLMANAPLTPAQARAAQIQRERAEASAILQARILSQPPKASGEPGARIPTLESMAGATSRGERSSPPSPAEQTRIARLSAYQADLNRRADRERYMALEESRQALGFIGSVTGAGFEELPPTPKRVYGGRKIRAIPNRNEPMFRMHIPTEGLRGDRAEVLAALEPEALAAREADLRARLQASTTGDLSGTDTTDIQRQLEATLNAKRPEVQAEIRAFLQNRSVAGIGRAARRSAGGAGATGQQRREKFMATLGDLAPGIDVSRSPGPFSIANLPGITSTLGGVGGASTPPTMTGGGPTGGGGPIDVRITASIPLQIAGMAAGGGGSATGVGGGGGGAAGGGGGGSAGGTGGGGGGGTPVENQGGKLQILRAPGTAQLPEQYRIRMRPRVAISAEQRAQEREQRERARASAAAGFAVAPSRARLRGLGVEFADINPDLLTGVDPVVARANAAVRGAAGRLPQRALSTSIVQIAENLFGGREGPLQRIAQLQNRTQDVGRLRASARQSELDEGAIQNRLAVVGAGTKEFRELTAAVTQQHRVTVQYNKAAEAAVKDVESLAKGAVTGGDVLRNLGAGAIGGVAGGLVAGGVAQVGQAAIQVADKVFGPMIERALGFQNETAKVTSALADATRAQGGNVKAVVAQTAANAGLSKATYDSISTALEQRTSVEASNKAIGDQIQLFHAADNITAGQGPIGAFFQGAGGTPGLTRATGGFFGTQIGATPSTIEQITGELPGDQTMARSLPFTTNIIDSLSNLIPGYQRSQQDLYQAVNGAQLDKSLKRFNEDAQKAGSKLQLVANASDAEVAATQKNLEAQGVDYAQRRAFEQGRIAITGGTGDAGTGDINDFLKAVGEGSLLPDPQVLLAGMQRQISATMHSIQNQLTQSLGNNLAGSAIQLLAQPIAPLGQGLVGPGAPASVRAAVAARQGQFNATAGGLIGRAEQGEAFLDQLKVPPQIRQDLADVGAQIQAITSDMASRQAANFWVDYNHDLAIAKRNVGDLVGLVQGAGGATSVTGVGTVGASRVGVLQNQDLRLGRENQVLGFNLQQNQLNFRTAVAGFSAPGLTGEERAARLEQAQRETSIQQRQLNNAKTIAGNEYEITGIINQRSLDDAKFQLASLPRNLDLKVNLELDQQQVALLDQTRQNIIADIQSYSAAGNAVISSMNDTLAQLEAAGAIYFNGLKDDVVKAFGEAFSTTPGGWPPGAGSPTGSNLGVPGTPATANQREDRNDTGGPGSVTGFGGSAVVIQILGGTYADEQSRTGLIRDVQFAVEQAMNRKASLIGLRTPR